MIQAMSTVASLSFCACVLVTNVALAGEAPERLRRPDIAAAVGYSYQRVFTTPLHLAVVSGSAGAALSQSVSGRAEIALAYGQTAEGLAAAAFRWGGSAIVRHGAFRAGAGAHMSSLVIARATKLVPMSDTGVGVHILVACEAESSKSRSLFVEARFDLDRLIGRHSTPLLWGPTVTVGYRF